MSLEHKCGVANIVLCQHVIAGAPPDVLVGSSEGTEYAVCFACADVIDNAQRLGMAAALVDANFASAVCNVCALKFRIPLTLPGEYDFYGRDGKLLMSTPDGKKRPQ